MKKIIYILTLVAATALTGCNFLDKEPDLRADIDSQKKVRLLLASAYEIGNYGPIGEFSSDNIIDNNTMDVSSHVNTKVPFNQMYDQLFAWDDVTSYSGQDSPYAIWEGAYNNIAVANQALSAIAELEKKDPTLNLSAERAEALLVRAYNHFVLVNVFCMPYRNDELSKEDLGVHYMTAAETTVKPDYDRSNVAEVYRLIKEDIDAALPNVSDSYYTVPKYHFNTKAAYALAARVALYMRRWDDVITYADRVLGTSPAQAEAVMFDAAAAKEYGNIEQEMYAWFSASSPSNLLITTSMSFSLYSYTPSSCRYTLNREARDYTFSGSGPCWSGNFPGANFWRFDANYGGFVAKLYEPFEYTDKVAGIGYPHALRREFATGETLLCRAEAKIMKGNLSGALADMKVWTKSYCCTKDLTDSNIRSFFAEGKRAYVVYPDDPEDAKHNNQHCPTLHNTDIDPAWNIPANNLPYVWCVLHLRRLETMHDGMRWFDIKRYGIELVHKIGYPAKYVELPWNDQRRAVQLPQEAILAGQQANPRVSGASAPALTGPTTDPNIADLLSIQNNKPTITPANEGK